MKNILILLVLTLTAFQCNQKTRTAENITKLGDTVELKIGDTVRLKDTDFSVRFNEVSEDNRCPEDVNCIQAGHALVIFSANGTEHTITKRPKVTVKQPMEGYIIELLEVNPYPTAAAPRPATGEYWVKLIIDK